MALAICTVLTVVVSCDQEDDNTPLPIEKKEREIKVSEMRYEKNPYDDQGMLHNEFLDFFITRVDLSSKEMNREKLFSLIEEFHSVKKIDFEASDIEIYHKVFDFYAEAKIHYPGSESISRLCKYFDIPILCDIIKWPFPTLLTLDDVEEGEATDRILKYIEEIKAAEAKILEDTRMDEIEKYALLNYATVARHSAAYWHNEMHVLKSQSNWSNADESLAAEYCWKCVGKSDVEGAIGGAITGAFAGGVGAGPGAGIGAGAASAASAVVEFFDWLW